jgi:hypothetical protein
MWWRPSSAWCCRRHPCGARQPCLHGRRAGGCSPAAAPPSSEHILATQVIALKRPSACALRRGPARGPCHLRTSPCASSRRSGIAGGRPCRWTSTEAQRCGR